MNCLKTGQARSTYRCLLQGNLTRVSALRLPESFRPVPRTRRLRPLVQHMMPR